MAVERKPGPLAGHSVGMVRVRDTVAEDMQTRKRIVMRTIIEILVPQTVDGFEELVWVDISKVVKRVVPIMEVGSVARVTIDLFGTAEAIDALEVSPGTVEAMRSFVNRWDERIAGTLPEDGDRCRLCRMPSHSTMQINQECVNKKACEARQAML